MLRKSSSDRRHQRDLIAVAELVVCVQEANVFVVYVYVEEAPQFALIVTQMRLERGKACAQSVEQVIDASGGALETRLVFRVLTERGGNRNCHIHPHLCNSFCRARAG